MASSSSAPACKTKRRAARPRQPLLRAATAAGLTAGTKSKQLNVRVTPALFEAAAKQAGSHSPAEVVEAALAVLATSGSFGPWLASQRGVLADVDPELLAQIDL